MGKLPTGQNQARDDQQKRRAGFITAVSMAVIWMAFIFYLSDQPAAISASGSLSVLSKILKVLAPALRMEAERIEQYNGLFRSCMHALVFLVLALLVFRAVKMRLCGKLKPAPVSLSICIAYALLDEIHQMFVPGRAFQLSDILLDAAGALAGIALYRLLVY